MRTGRRGIHNAKMSHENAGLKEGLQKLKKTEGDRRMDVHRLYLLYWAVSCAPWSKVVKLTFIFDFNNPPKCHRGSCLLTLQVRPSGRIVTSARGSATGEAIQFLASPLEDSLVVSKRTGQRNIPED